jgi:hypothetical protein
MSFIRRSPTPHSPVAARLDLVHRAGAAVLGAGLCAFGVLGFLAAPAFLSTDGVRVLGMGSNGLLSLISLVVGVVLVVAACRGGTISSTLTVVIGVLFLLSGLLGIAVLHGPFNLLGFRWQNVAFSLTCGTVLLFTGSYGRFTAGLPSENPYYQHRHPRPAGFAAAERDDEASEVDWRRIAAAAAEMAEAERAVAQGAWGAECARVRALAGLATHEARLRAWLADRESPGADVRR